MGGAYPDAICGCTAPTSGTHNVYLEFVSGAGGNPPYVSLHYFNFPAS